MKVKSKPTSQESSEPYAESNRNFMQVPPMQRHIPAPKTKQVLEHTVAGQKNNPSV